jgi:putative flippase GtrA
MEQKHEPIKLTKRQEILKFLQFLFFSLSAAVVQISVFTLLSQVIGLSYWLAYLPALIASVIWNFTVNRKFTFKSITNVPVAMLKLIAYYAVFTPLSTWWGNALSKLDAGISAVLLEYGILIGTMLVNFATEFCVYRFWIFGSSINTSEAGKREQERVEAQENSSSK